MKSGKLNLIIDMQFGSTGKGLLASYLATFNHIDLAVSNLSPNAGHTFEYKSGFAVSKQIPIGCIINKRCGAYLTAGSIINIDLLFEEMEKFDISEDRIVIHPNATIITKEDIYNESIPLSSVGIIGSTMSGTGFALANKIRRSAKVAKDYESCILKQMVRTIDLHQLMDADCTLLMESSQGFDLSLNGSFYPHCTSRDITVSSLLNDAQVHPHYLGDVYGCMRTYPIRVGNIMFENEVLGYSGDFYKDSVETSWEALGLSNELTTNTKRVRRVATFSELQYKRALDILRPDHIFCNFMNQVKDQKHLDHLYNIFSKTKRYPDILGYGPNIKDVEIRFT